MFDKFNLFMIQEYESKSDEQNRQVVREKDLDDENAAFFQWALDSLKNCEITKNCEIIS